MKSMFGKLLPYFLALVIIEVIVIIILAIWTFQGTIYDFISKSSVAFNILGFIADWAEVITGAIVLAALVLVYISFRKFQRGRAINRLHNWARNGVVILAQYRQESAGAADSPAERYEDVGVLLDKLMAKSSPALADARKLRGEIHARTRKTVEELRVVKVKLANEDESLFDDLQALQHDFADVMILAFELIK
jgi:ABC-type multidrug transport system fused ATPase/permease subunit